MKKLTELLEVTDYVEIRGEPGIEIVCLVIDSRKAVQGSLFFALSGTSADGHAFINDAAGLGAVAVICQTFPEEMSSSLCYIKVNDSAYALGIIASAFYGEPSRRLRLVGVTGTNGKTTTATLLHKLFLSLGHKAGLISTINYIVNNKVTPATHTTPDPLRLNHLLDEMVKEGCEYCFMEVSSHSINQKRIAGLSFTGGIFTNISHDHLDYHKTFSEYLRVKKQFFDNLGPGSFALINNDDRNASYMVQNTKATVKTFSLRSVSDFKGGITERDFGGMLVTLDGSELWTGFIGDFNASNILAVYSTALLLGADRDEVLRIISSLDPVEGRFETIRSDGRVTAIVDYAHTPDALDNVISAVIQLKGRNARLITVAGAGGDRDRDKRPLMAKIAAGKSDMLILTSDNPRSEDPEAIIEDMMRGVSDSDRNRVLCISKREEAIRTACMLAAEGDYVLVAGKGHEKYQEVKGVRHHFDDREVVRMVFSSLQKNG